MRTAEKLTVKRARQRLEVQKQQVKIKEVPEEIKDLRCPGGVSKVGMITPSSDPGQTTVAGIAVKLPTIPQSGDGVSCQRLSRRLCRDGTFS